MSNSLDLDETPSYSLYRPNPSYLHMEHSRAWRAKGLAALQNYLLAFSFFYYPPLTLSLPNELSSAKFLVCCSSQTASMSLKSGENVVRVSNSLDPDETQSYSASHPDPSRLHMTL